MDIRNYLGGSGKTHFESGSSALSSIKKAKPVSPITTRKRSQKVEPSLDNNPKRSRTSVVELIDGNSDGESPIHGSLRREVVKKRQKLSRIIVESDSDDEAPIPGIRKEETRLSLSPVKSRSKKVKINTNVPTPHKSDVESGSGAKTMSEDDSDGMVTGTDSENEFIEKKVPKKSKMLPGQKKLNFTLQTKNQLPKKDISKPKGNLQRISAAAFFDSSSTRTDVTTTEITPEKIRKHDLDRGQNGRKRKLAEKKEPNEKNEKDYSKEISGSEKTKSKTSVKEQITQEVPRNSIPNIFPEKHIPNTAKASKKVKMATIEKSEYQNLVANTERNLPAENNSQVPMEVVPWVDKHMPRSISQLIGQHGDKSPMNKLLGWLKDWAKHNLGEGAKIKKPKPPPFLTQTDGIPFKAVLLSGSPGIGKTTCAHMACQNFGFKVVEMNASDVRSKKQLESQIAQLVGSHQIDEYFKNKAGGKGGDTEVNHVLIMDEVDGMSGNEDRAGVAELIQIIKDTKIPIICICNDRSHPKIRSLANHCFDVRFPKPRVEQIRGRIMSIASQERMKISKDELDQLIEISGHDVRQTIYNLQMRAALIGDDMQKKDVTIGPFEAARKLLDSRSTLIEKQDMFFVDYNIMPLFVQENYPNMKNDKHKPGDAISGLRLAADLISLGDIVDRCIRTSGSWKLLNEQCMLGCALPSIAVDGHMRSMIQFPTWLGKNSTANKRQRLMRQLVCHAHLNISADTQSLVMDYVPVLREKLTRPMIENESEGVQSVVATMTEYDLIRDDYEAVAELGVWPGKIDPASKIPSKVKAAFTRALNKEHRLLPYALEEFSKGRKRAVIDAIASVEVDEDGNIIERAEEDGENEEEEEEEQKTIPKARSTQSTRGRGGRGSAASGRGGAKRGRTEK